MMLQSCRWPHADSLTCTAMLAEQYKPIYTLLPVMTLPGETIAQLSPNALPDYGKSFNGFCKLYHCMHA